MERLSKTSANAEGRRAVIIVRTATGQEVQGWRMTHPAIRAGQRVLLDPDGIACTPIEFGLRGMRATATTAAERTALERGGYLQLPHRKAG
jgi:hypothetical protein